MPSKNSKPLKKSQKSSGLFVTFEGGEGSGKTTLIERLNQTFKEKGLATLVTREPGGFETGQKIRDIVLHQKENPIGPRCELLLYLADRAQHVEEVILPALNRGEIVLCDRYNDSTLAYQGKGRALDIGFLRQMCAFAVDGLVPNLTIFLDLDPALGFERVQKMGRERDRVESEALAFHQAVREAYLQFAEEEPERFRVIDATLSPEAVFQKALSEIDASLTQIATRA